MLGTSSTGPRDRAYLRPGPGGDSLLAYVTFVWGCCHRSRFEGLLLPLIIDGQFKSNFSYNMFGINHAILRGFLFNFHFMYLCVPVITCIVPVQLQTSLQTCRLRTMSNTHAVTIHSKIKTKHHADKCFIHITSKLRYSVVIHLTTPVRIIKVN